MRGLGLGWGGSTGWVARVDRWGLVARGAGVGRQGGSLGWVAGVGRLLYLLLAMGGSGAATHPEQTHRQTNRQTNPKTGPPKANTARSEILRSVTLTLIVIYIHVVGHTF